MTEVETNQLRSDHDGAEHIEQTITTTSPSMEEQRRNDTIESGNQFIRSHTDNTNITYRQRRDNSIDPIVIQKWKESPFAVGLTYSTWQEEKVSCKMMCCRCLEDENHNNHNNLSAGGLSALVCKWTPFGRIGNMIILYQSTETYTTTITTADNQQQQEQRTRPKIHFIVGPYWMVLCGITIPLFSFICLAAGLLRIPDYDWPIIITWGFCNVMLFVSLLNVACRDPGILYRYEQKPTNTDDDWIWNDQALTYRPRSAKYDSDCAVVIDGFDHVCPWTGTAIGKKNHCWFRMFVLFVFITFLYNCALLVFSVGVVTAY